MVATCFPHQLWPKDIGHRADHAPLSWTRRWGPPLFEIPELFRQVAIDVERILNDQKPAIIQSRLQ